MITNNDILKKLRVALQLRDDQIVEILELVDFRVSKGEIGNFFRAEDHPKYMECQDQILRNFLNGLVIYLRGTKENPKNPQEVLKKNKEQMHAGKENNSKPKPVIKAAKETPKKEEFKPKKKTFSAKPNVLGNIKFNNGKKKKD